MTTVQDALCADLDDGFRRLVESMRDRVFAFALSLTNSRHDADDVAQDTFVRAYRALKAYAPARIRELKPKPWLAKIALNVWRNRLRSRHMEAELDDQWNADPDEAPDIRAERNEGAARVRALLQTLPERYRVAMVMRYAYDLPYAQAANALGMPVGTLKANVHRGTRMLRDAWYADAHARATRTTPGDQKRRHS